MHLPSLSAIRSSNLRDVHAANPLQWIDDCTSDEIWSAQRRIMESVRDHRRTAVPSCHGPGKSFIAARIARWWIESHTLGKAFVVTSAPTGRQVRAILWREMSRTHADGGIGRINQTELWATMPDGHEEMVAFGQKPADLDPAAFQGIHEQFVLIIFDEGGGMSKTLVDAGDTALTSEQSRFLIIGNPDDGTSEFARMCDPGSEWNVIRISAFDTPCITGEPVSRRMQTNLISRLWIEEKARKWIGESCPHCQCDLDLLQIRSSPYTCPHCDELIPLLSLYVSKVLAQFPESSEESLIPLAWISAAQERTLMPGEPHCLGVDVGAGTDKSTVCHRQGNVFRIIRRDQNPDTMVTCGNVIRDLRRTNTSKAKVDDIGIGRGVVDRGKELKRTKKITQSFVGVNVGGKSTDSSEYTNLRAQAWWAVRERFERGDIDIDSRDDELAAQLADVRLKPRSDGRIQIESKEDMKKRGRSSPDDADALMLSTVEVKVQTRMTFGKRRK